jgi:transposase
VARYKTYDYQQRVLVPVSLEDQLIPGTLEFAIHTLVGKRLDLSIFEGKYRNDETGRAAYDPKVLFKVVLLAYSRGLISSRKIERACQENVVFMALACSQHPDHSTIAAFVSSMKEEILPLFRDVLLVCEEMNLLGGTMFALDGRSRLRWRSCWLNRCKLTGGRMILPAPGDRGPAGSSRSRNYKRRQSCLINGWPKTSPSRARLVEKSRVILRTMIRP